MEDKALNEAGDAFVRKNKCRDLQKRLDEMSDKYVAMSKEVEVYMAFIKELQSKCRNTLEKPKNLEVYSEQKGKMFKAVAVNGEQVDWMDMDTKEMLSCRNQRLEKELIQKRLDVALDRINILEEIVYKK